MRRLACLGLLPATIACCAAAAEDTGARLSLSIYSAAANNGEALFAPTGPDSGTPGGYAIVRDRRVLELKAGDNVILVRDASRFLDPAALSARLVGDTDGAEIVAQRFDDETLSLEALVQRHIGHPVEIHPGGAAATAPAISGVLLSNAGGLTVQTADGRVTTITEISRITFPDLPKGLAGTPTLRWDIAAKKSGARTLEIVYPSQGLGWRAEYSGWVAAGDCKLALSGWAQIANRSGTDYAGARVKLIAGEPHRTAAPAPQPRAMARLAAAPLQAEEGAGVGDYHEYLLDNSIDIASGTLLRAALFGAQTLPCQRQYLFEASRMRANPGMAPITDRNYGAGEGSAPVRSTLTFKSDRALPAGTLRVLQNASDGTPEFIGEDALAHTPKGQTVAVELGNAFDLRGERRQTEFQFDKERRTASESFAIKLSNGSAAAQSVVVREHLYRWNQWSIAQSSSKYEKRSADTIDFNVDVPANGSAQVTYTVQYQWSEGFK